MKFELLNNDKTSYLSVQHRESYTTGNPVVEKSRDDIASNSSQLLSSTTTSTPKSETKAPAAEVEIKNLPK